MKFPGINKVGMAMIVCLLTFSSCTNIQVKTSDRSKPNIVFILIDDQAWNVLGKDGRYEFLKTPNLDQLSREGLVFENAFVTTSLCSPSRACFLTGSYAHTNGVYINSYSDPNPEVPMLPKILQEAGYETAFMGKWHMKHGAEPREGFDYWLSFDGQGKYINPPLNENGRDFIEKGYMTDILTGYATRWMKRSREKPFCLFLWHKAVHAPFTPAPRDSAAFPDALIPEYENWYDTMEGKPEWLRRGWFYGVHNNDWHASEEKPVPEKIVPHPWDPQNPRWMNYLRAMLAVDKSMGDVRRCLKELRILDNTIIVFASDNGFFLGSHQRSDKRLMYEESLRIPLIIRYPELIKAGSKNSNLVLNIDVAPTLIELSGAEVPEDMQGVSLVPLLNNGDSEWRESFMYEYFQESYAPGFVTATGVRNKRYKYIEYPGMVDDIDELYDLEMDPGEMTNLIGSSDFQMVKSEMKAELERLKMETGYFDPGVYKEEVHPYTYLVQGCKEPPNINSVWDKEFWKDVLPVKLDNFMGNKPSHFPETHVKLRYDNQYIYVIFSVKDQYVKAVAKKRNGKVWQDSCVEFFFTPGPDAARGYFNFETNCKGVYLFQYHTGDGENSGFVDEEDCKEIIVSHSLTKDVEEELVKPESWTLEYRIPIAVLEKYMEVDKPGPKTMWRANFYKCADGTSHPHWLTWATVKHPKPKFHLPEFFGQLEFE